MKIIRRQLGLSNTTYSVMDKIIIKKYKQKDSRKIKKKREVLNKVLPGNTRLPKAYLFIRDIEIREFVDGHLPESKKNFKKIGEILSKIHKNGEYISKDNLESYFDILRGEIKIPDTRYLKIVGKEIIYSRETIILEDCGKYNWIVGKDNNFYFIDYERVCFGNPSIDLASLILGSPEYVSEILNGYEKRGHLDFKLIWKGMIAKSIEVYNHFYREYGSVCEKKYPFLKKYKKVLQYSENHIKNEAELMDIIIDLSV